MAAVSHLQSDEELEREIAQCRFDVARFTACCRKPWNEGQHNKCRQQLHAAERHLARLERLRGGA